MWSYAPNLGIFELEERDGEYYMPSSMVKAKQYFYSKEEATIYYYRVKIKKIMAEKENLETRISKLNKLIDDTNKLYNIHELKLSHPEHFLEDIN